LLTVLVYTAFGWHGILAGILFRVVAIPVIAGISYELLRLGAKFPGSPVLRALMKPGLWLQKISTRPPDRGQIEVAIAAFEARLRARQERDPEMAEYLRQEEVAAQASAEELERRLEVLLLPKDPNDDKDVVLEIRAGTGGQEASLFASDLYEMYRRYAERNR